MQSYLAALALTLAMTANVRYIHPLDYGVRYDGQVVRKYVYDENTKQFILDPSFTCGRGK